MRWLACVCVLSLFAIQDPESRPTKRQLPPIEEPYRTEVERRDLLQEFTEPSPLEGVYRLRSISRAGGAAVANGYLHIGRKHLALQTSITSARRKTPYLQSSVRTYRLQGEKIVMTTLFGHVFDERLGIEEPGRVEVRRFQRAGTVLRIFQDDAKSFMEFVRVE